MEVLGWDLERSLLESPYLIKPFQTLSPSPMALMKSGAGRTPVPNPATSHVFGPYPLTP